MTNQIKPRYRLGTQNMLDLAKDDATKIPERTLFRLSGKYMPKHLNGTEVLRRSPAGFGLDDYASVCFHAVGSEQYAHLSAEDLQPLI